MPMPAAPILHRHITTLSDILGVDAIRDERCPVGAFVSGEMVVYSEPRLALDCLAIVVWRRAGLPATDLRAVREKILAMTIDSECK